MEEHQEQEQESRRPLQEDRDEDNLEFEECVKSYHHQNDGKCRFVEQQNLFIQNK